MSRRYTDTLSVDLDPVTAARVEVEAARRRVARATVIREALDDRYDPARGNVHRARSKPSRNHPWNAAGRAAAARARARKAGTA